MEQRVILIDARAVARHKEIAPMQIGENLFAPLVFGQRNDRVRAHLRQQRAFQQYISDVGFSLLQQFARKVVEDIFGDEVADRAGLNFLLREPLN